MLMEQHMMQIKLLMRQETEYWVNKSPMVVVNKNQSIRINESATLRLNSKNC